MLRFIIRRKLGDNISGYATEGFETVDVLCNELERILTGGGSSENGFDIRELAGVEVIYKEDTPITANNEQFIVGNKYHWKCDHDTKLVYLGHNWSGNGYWHQFAKVESPDDVWCEVLTRDLHMLEETKPAMQERQS